MTSDYYLMNGRPLCADCFYAEYFMCNGCFRIFPMRMMVEDDGEVEIYCPPCYREARKRGDLG
jgi:hypothetical protein